MPPSTATPILQNGQWSIETFLTPSNDRLNYAKLSNPKHSGTDKALLFIPGLGGSVLGAVSFLDHLLPYYSAIYALDLRGFGINAPEDNIHPLYSTQPILNDLKAFTTLLDQTSQHQAMDLCGISLGGALATLLASGQQHFYKNGFHRLALLVPAFEGSRKKFTTAYVFKAIAQRLLKGRGFRTALPYSIESLTQNPVILQNWAQKQGPPLMLSIEFLLSVRAIGRAALKQTSCLSLPTIMAVAHLDSVCDPQRMLQGFKNIPKDTPKKLLEYPELFHDILFENEAVNIAKEIGEWLNQDSLQSSADKGHTNNPIPQCALEYQADTCLVND